MVRLCSFIAAALIAVAAGIRNRRASKGTDLAFVNATKAICASFSTWPNVDGVTCGEGSCTALIEAEAYGNRCDTYCESFGHTCAGAWEEVREDCEIKDTYQCNEVVAPASSDILCKCINGGPAPSPAPSPAPGGDTCWDFLYWPGVDGVTCGSCTALIQAEAYGNRCDTYCDSFGHTCAGAWEEVNENCEIKDTYQCNQVVASGSSDILCKCVGNVGLPPTPSAPMGETLVDTPCVNLMLVGDYGSRSDTQTRVASGMNTAAGQSSPIAIIGLGDNIYPNGAEDGPTDVLTWWKEIYTTKANLQKPWYAITGNHDWYSDARVERSFTTDSRNNFWQMPDFWYQQTFTSTVSGLKVDTFFIDTMVWISSRAPSYIGSSATTEQKLWLDSALSNSTADWKIVMGHHPVYSRGSHGVTSQLFADLDPMMRRHGVQLYACGHDHSSHLIQYEGLSYVVSGAGGKSPRTPSNEYPSGSLTRDHQNPGFASLELCKDSPGELKYFSQDGSVQSTTQIPISAPTPGLTGSVRLANGDTLQFPNGRALATAAASEMCGGRKMQQVDKFCKSVDGSGCRVIADQPTYLTCDRYCKDNGLSCKNGWEQEDEDCVPVKELGCHAGTAGIDALICECMP